MKHPNIKLALFALVISLFTISNASATQTDIAGPEGSGQFGYQVVALPNGYIVISDPYYDAPGPIADVGAVYLYKGAAGELISTFTGSTANDRVGSGITLLTNGNYVVSSPIWDNPLLAVNNDAGAITWCSGTTGCSGTVSAANSLVGGTKDDIVGYGSITELTNGNYVVASYNWSNPSSPDADVGAVTWCSGAGGTTGIVSSSNSLIGAGGDSIGTGGGIYPLSNGNYVVSSPYSSSQPPPSQIFLGVVTWGNGQGGTTGVVSASNSLIGGSANDGVGLGIYTLSNGNYVVLSATWDNPSPSVADVGAVTWGNGLGGTVGLITASNSLIGSSAGDMVGTRGILTLTNGNYVVLSPFWDNPSPTVADVGAATWANGLGGTVGAVSASNSLIGGSAGDNVSSGANSALTNGNYVLSNVKWDNPSPLIANVGAVTWGNGQGGTIGLVSPSNSLIGGTANDAVGSITALANGNYVVRSPNWDNPSPLTTDVGAIIWGNGSGGTVGVVSASNSLVGSASGDNVGSGGITVLTNGNYVVKSPNWDNPTLAADNNAGAATWENGMTNPTGVVSTGNSLVGGSAGDNVSSGGITRLTNNNYVVSSPNWDNTSPLIIDVGAATWCNGTGETIGLVSVNNSLVGGSAGDKISSGNVTQLLNGNYVVSSQSWDNPSTSIPNVGAVTWGNGAVGTTGIVSMSNSLVGGSANDNLGNAGIYLLSNGSYVVKSSVWDNPVNSIIDAGEISYGVGSGGTFGLITANNSVSGTTAGGGFRLGYGFDALNNQLAVGRPLSNIVTLFKPTATPKSNKRIRISF